MVVLILMGVCGSGKTGLAKQLHDKLGWPVAEADDYHPRENVSKMSKNIALTDEDRYPWLVALHNAIKGFENEQQSAIVTCSALKRVYRDILRYGPAWVEKNLQNVNNEEERSADTNSSQSHLLHNIHSDNPELAQEKAVKTDKELHGIPNIPLTPVAKSEYPNIKFIYLKGSMELIKERVQSRVGHFMPASLVESQFSILEEPDKECENCLHVNVKKSIEDIASEIIANVKQ